MNDRLRRGVVTALFFLQGLYFAYLALGIAMLYRGASNVDPGAALPFSVWRFAGLALLCAVVGGVYWTGSFGIQSWIRGVAIVCLAYGAWSTLTGFPLVLAWSGLWHGDVVALGVASGVAFIAIGIIGLLPPRGR